MENENGREYKLMQSRLDKLESLILKLAEDKAKDTEAKREEFRVKEIEARQARDAQQALLIGGLIDKVVDKIKDMAGFIVEQELRLNEQEAKNYEHTFSQTVTRGSKK